MENGVSRQKGGGGASMAERGKKPGAAMIVFSVCSILQKCMPFILMPFLTRMLSVEDYGIYSAYSAWLTILASVCTLNLHLGVFNNGMHRFAEDRERYASAMVWVTILLLMLFSALALPLRKRLSGWFSLPGEYVPWMLVQILFQQFFNLWVAKERYIYGFRRLLALVGLYCAAGTAFPAAALYLWRADAAGVIISAVLVQVLFGTVCAAELLIRGRCSANGTYIRYAVGFNLALMPHYLSGVILGQVDRTMINSMCGAVSAAVYSVAHTFALALNFAVSSVNAAIVPWTYEAMAKKRMKELNRITAILAGSFAVLLCIFVLVMPEIMKLFVTREYYDAVRLVPPIAVSSYFIFLYNLFANVEFYFEAKYFISVSSLLAAVLNVALNYVFITRYGYTAAAYTTGVCYALYALFHFINVRRLGKKHLPGEALYPMKILAAAAGLLSAGVLGILPVYDSVIVRYVLLAVIFAAVFVKRKELIKEVRYVFTEEKGQA